MVFLGFLLALRYFFSLIDLFIFVIIWAAAVLNLVCRFRFSIVNAQNGGYGFVSIDQVTFVYQFAIYKFYLRKMSNRATL